VEHKKRQPIAIGDGYKEQKPHLQMKTASKASLKFEGYHIPGLFSSRIRAAPPTADFSQFVKKVLRGCVRLVGWQVQQEDGKPDRSAVPYSSYSHLTEMVVRKALREHWDMQDFKTVAQRIRQLMFDPKSDLVEVARSSGLQFVEDDAAGNLAETSDMPRPVSSLDMKSSIAADEFTELYTELLEGSLSKHGSSVFLLTSTKRYCHRLVYSY